MSISKHPVTFTVLLAIIACIFLFGYESNEERREIYGAWCKLYRRNDITIEEWQMLRKNYLLPGMNEKAAIDAANSAAALSGVAIGLSATSGSR